MALRNIRTTGDNILRKKCRKITDFGNKRLHVLIKDMYDTLYDTEIGIGLAAPQVGILWRVVVIDVNDSPLTLINPEILEASGSVIDTEGCLSVPETEGDVERPQKVRIKAYNEAGEEFEMYAEDILARVICHETDHLDGVLFTDKLVEGEE